MSSPKSSIVPVLLALSLASGLCLLPVACTEPTEPPPVGGNPGGGKPGTPGEPGPGGNADGGLVLASDGGTFAAKPACGGGATCAGACPDGGSVCLGNCGFLPPVRYPLGGEQADLAVGDVQGDGVEDLVTANTRGQAISVLLNRRQGLFQTPSLWGASPPTSLTLARLDANASLDVLFASGAGSTLGVYRGQGDGTFDSLVSTPSGSALRGVAVWESNGSRRAAVINADSQVVSVFPVNSDGSLGTKVDYSAPTGLHSLVVADFNGDGRSDLAVSHSDPCTSAENTACQSVSVLLGKSDDTFEAQRITSTGGTPLGLVAARLDTDVLMDLVVADSSRHQVLVLSGRGDGSFVVQASYPTVRSPSRLALVDINRDSLPDLVVGGLGSELSVLLGQPGGTFAAQVPLTASTQESGVRALAAADFDKDGSNDLAVLTGTGVQLLWGVCR